MHIVIMMPLIFFEEEEFVDGKKLVKLSEVSVGDGGQGAKEVNGNLRGFGSRINEKITCRVTWVLAWMHWNCLKMKTLSTLNLANWSPLKVFTQRVRKWFLKRVSISAWTWVFESLLQFQKNVVVTTELEKRDSWLEHVRYEFDGASRVSIHMNLLTSVGLRKIPIILFLSWVSRTSYWKIFRWCC